MHAERLTARPRLECSLVPVIRSRTPAWHSAVSLLGRDDRTRIATCRAARREAFLTGRTELRRLGARWLDVPAADVAITTTCPHCRSAAHGRPTLGAPDGQVLQASVAHAGDHVLVAVSPDRSVGADLEVDEGVAFDGYDRTALTGSECEKVASAEPYLRGWLRSRLWTAKEAVLKVSGDGLAVDPRNVAVEDPSMLRTSARLRLPGRVTRAYSVSYIAAPAGYTASVAA